MSRFAFAMAGKFGRRAGASLARFSAFDPTTLPARRNIVSNCRNALLHSEGRFASPQRTCLQSFSTGAVNADDNEFFDDHDAQFEEDPVVYLAEEELQKQYHDKILRRLEAGYFDQAMEVYEEAEAERVQALPETRVEMIYYSPSISDALDILQDMNRNGDRPSVVVYNEVLKRCSEHKLEYTALRLLREMEKYGIEPNADSYSWVIRTIGRSRRNNHQVAYDFAMDIAREKQMFVTERMFLELLKACKLKSSLPMIHKIMDTILDSGTPPSAAIFNAAMGVASRSDAIDYAFQLYDRMLELGVRPTTSTYCLLIMAIHDRYSEDLDMQHRAIELFRTMLTNEVAPTVEACGAIENIAKTLGDDDTYEMALESAEIVESLLQDSYHEM